jgi:hypothetical protein
MRRIYFGVLVMVLAGVCQAQRENVQYAAEYASTTNTTVGEMITAAQANCIPSTLIPCYIVIDPTLAAFAPGAMPAKCAQCVWQDFRTKAGTANVAAIPLGSLCIFEGDSRQQIYHIATPPTAISDYLAAMSQFQNCSVINVAVSGSSMVNTATPALSVTARYAANVQPYRPASNGGHQAFLFLLDGYNDLQSVAPATLLATVQSYAAQAQADGFTFVAETEPNYDPSAPPLPAVVAQGVIYNNLLRQSYASWNFLADIRALNLNPLDASLYNTDHIHPLPLGNLMIAQFINGVFGGAGSSSAVSGIAPPPQNALFQSGDTVAANGWESGNIWLGLDGFISLQRANLTANTEYVSLSPSTFTIGPQYQATASSSDMFCVDAITGSPLALVPGCFQETQAGQMTVTSASLSVPATTVNGVVSVAQPTPGSGGSYAQKFFYGAYLTASVSVDAAGDLSLSPGTGGAVVANGIVSISQTTGGSGPSNCLKMYYGSYSQTCIYTDTNGNVTATPATGKSLVSPSFAETLTTPASSSAACSVGQFGDDANYHYVCTATNTWKRVALSTF